MKSIAAGLILTALIAWICTGCTSTNFIVSKTTWNGEHEEKLEVKGDRVSFAHKLYVTAGLDERGYPSIRYSNDGGADVARKTAAGITAGAIKGAL